jgi:hypothetical protein
LKSLAPTKSNLIIVGFSLSSYFSHNAPMAVFFFERNSKIKRFRSKQNSRLQ